jgi:hypothetical protein
LPSTQASCPGGIGEPAAAGRRSDAKLKALATQFDAAQGMRALYGEPHTGGRPTNSERGASIHDSRAIVRVEIDPEAAFPDLDRSPRRTPPPPSPARWDLRAGLGPHQSGRLSAAIRPSSPFGFTA